MKKFITVAFVLSLMIIAAIAVTADYSVKDLTSGNSLEYITSSNEYRLGQLMKVSSTLLDLSGIDDFGATLIKSNGYIAFTNGSDVVQFGTGEGMWNVVDDDVNGDRSAAFGEWWLNSVGKISWNQNNGVFTLGTTANSTSTDTNSLLTLADGSLILSKGGVQHFSIESLGWGGGYLRMTDTYSGLIAANNTVRLRIDPDGTGNYAFDTISSDGGDVQLSILPDYINNPYVGMYVLTGNQYGTNLANNTIRMSQNGGGGYTKGLQLFGAGAAIDEFSTDGTLAGDSNTAVPTEQAVKTYVDTNALNNGITNNSSYWLCTAANCLASCQVQIVGGLITGCV